MAKHVTGFVSVMAISGIMFKRSINTICRAGKCRHGGNQGGPCGRFAGLAQIRDALWWKLRCGCAAARCKSLCRAAGPERRRVLIVATYTGLTNAGLALCRRRDQFNKSHRYSGGNAPAGLRALRHAGIHFATEWARVFTVDRRHGQTSRCHVPKTCRDISASSLASTGLVAPGSRPPRDTGPTETRCSASTLFRNEPNMRFTW